MKNREKALLNITHSVTVGPLSSRSVLDGAASSLGARELTGTEKWMQNF